MSREELIRICEQQPALVFVCPHCHAQVGEFCRRPNGRLYKPGHDARLMALQEARAVWRKERQVYEPDSN